MEEGSWDEDGVSFHIFTGGKETLEARALKEKIDENRLVDEVLKEL